MAWAVTGNWMFASSAGLFVVDVVVAVWFFCSCSCLFVCLFLMAVI